MTLYPASIDTYVGLLQPINNYSTLVVGPVDGAQTGITVSGDTSLLPASGVVSIDDEVIEYAFINVSGPNPVLSGCTRGYDGTSTASHASGASVEVRWVALHHNILTSAIVAIEAALGALPYGSADTVSDRIVNTEPIVVSKTGANWTTTHTKKRLVIVQLYEYNSGTGYYDLFDGGVSQNVDVSGVSTIYVTNNSKTGYMILY